MKRALQRIALKTGLAVAGVVIATSALAQLAPGDHSGGDRGVKMFERFDADGDGVISKAEAENARASHFAKLDGDGDGAITEAEMIASIQSRVAERAAKKFDRIDANGDGRISQAEFAAKSERRFAQVDANGDGMISRAEARDGMRRHHKAN